MNKSVVGVLTIGQSPRVDVVPSLENCFDSRISIKEAGALDRLSKYELSKIKSTSDIKDVYVSRLRNGESIKINKEKLIPFLQDELIELESVSDVIIMLCTGDFPMLKASKPVIYPDKVLSHSIKGIMQSDSLGLIIPLEEQRETIVKKWNQRELCTITAVASPYEDSNVFEAAQSLKVQGVKMIVLDCMGYNEYHKETAVKASGLPVILPRTFIASIVNEYLL